jgi:Raf kinase inhibitor-like YbhB/YbcL family protein
MRAMDRWFIAAWMGMVLACGSDKERDEAGQNGDDSADDAPGGSGTDQPAPRGFVLTSTAFDDGERIPGLYTCASLDVSPPLAWSGQAAAGYALVLTDQTEGAIHWVLWDVPGDMASLPEGIEKVPEPKVPAGAKQALAIDDRTRGYSGPCPSDQRHLYQFALYAVDEYPLSGVTLDSTRVQLVEVLAQRSDAKASMRVTFEPSGW